MIGSPKWSTSTVSDEFEVQLGKRLDAAVNRGELRWCINNRGVRWGRVLVKESIQAPLTTVDIQDLRLVVGDVLMCEGGEIGRAAVWNGELPDAYFLNTLHRLRSKGRYDPRLLVAFFERWASTGELSAIVGKATLAHLTKENLVRVSLPVPPLEEQVWIVETLSDADQLINGLQRIIAKKQAIKQGMMQELLAGETRLPGFSEAWMKCTLADLAHIVSGGTPSSAVPDFWDGGIAWCTPSDITGQSGRYLQCTERTISSEGLTRSSAQLLPKGSLLLCTRATIGEVKIALWSVATNQGFKSLVPKVGVFSEYLYYKMLTLKAELIGYGTGSTFLEVSRRDVAALQFDVPSPREQIAIAETLTDIDDEIDSLYGCLSKSKAIKQGMMQELLTGRTRLQISKGAV